jgi:hypothetical protein
MPPKRYIVSVNDVTKSEPGGFADVVDRLRRAGFQVSHTLEALGLVLGSADPLVLDRLRAVPGVAAIDEERETGPLGSSQP